MIRLDNIAKQNGHQILFVEASAALQKGEKIGLVGPNGSGKTTLFRMIMGEEQPDEGQVAVDRGVTVGYFSQDVGEMGGRSVLEETMAGAGEVSEAAHELHGLEHAMADPAGYYLWCWQNPDPQRPVERIGPRRPRVVLELASQVFGLYVDGA